MPGEQFVAEAFCRGTMCRIGGEVASFLRIFAQVVELVDVVGPVSVLVVSAANHVLRSRLSDVEFSEDRCIVSAGRGIANERSETCTVRWAEIGHSAEFSKSLLERDDA